MKTFEDVQRILSARLPEIREKFSVKSLGIFGSYVRDEQTKNSDLDILVEFDNEHYPSYSAYIDLEYYLQNLLEISIDLFPKHALRKRLEAQILAEVKEL